MSRMENWKLIPDHCFKNYGGLNFLLRCNYDKKLLTQMKISLFYKQILTYFLELKTLYGGGHGGLRCCGVANFFTRCCGE